MKIFIRIVLIILIGGIAGQILLFSKHIVLAVNNNIGSANFDGDRMKANRFESRTDPSNNFLDLSAGVTGLKLNGDIIASGSVTAQGLVNNGALSSNGTITAPLFSGDLSGNATTATTATNQNGGTINATTGTFSGNVSLNHSNANVLTANGTDGSYGALTVSGSKNGYAGIRFYLTENDDAYLINSSRYTGVYHGIHGTVEGVQTYWDFYADNTTGFSVNPNKYMPNGVTAYSNTTDDATYPLILRDGNGTNKFLFRSDGAMYATLPAATGSTTIWYSGGWLYRNTSSRRYKHNIQNFSDDWKKVLQVQPRSFDFNANGMHDVGYIAEEIFDLGLKDLVTFEDGKIEALRYDRFALYAIEILKEHEKTINTLVIEKDAQKKEIIKLQERLTKLEAIVEELKK